MTPLERRAQVEELHARRAVFADAMNAERLAEYEARKALLRCAVDINVTSRAAPCVTKQSQEERVVRRLNWPIDLAGITKRRRAAASASEKGNQLGSPKENGWQGARQGVSAPHYTVIRSSAAS